MGGAYSFKKSTIIFNIVCRIGLGLNIAFLVIPFSSFYNHYEYFVLNKVAKNKYARVRSVHATCTVEYVAKPTAVRGTAPHKSNEA
jgi:hypothetical protein